MAVPFIRSSFASGEISPELYGHVDLAKIESAATTARNMFVSFKGGMNSRAGTRYIATSDQTGTGVPPRIITWQFNNQQGYVLEFGNLYVAFYFQGAQVLSAPNTPYTIVSPYNATDLPLLKFAQSADVMTITHPTYPPYDLARDGPTNWTLTPTQIGVLSIFPPANVTATATTNPSGATSPPTLPCAYAYQVTAVDATTGQETYPSNTANVVNSVDMSATAGSIIINWMPSAGAISQYNIYRSPTSYNTQPGNSGAALPVPVGSLFGFVGSTLGTQFVDTNITPNFSQTPPIFNSPLAPGRVLDISITASSSDWTNATVALPSAQGIGFAGIVVISNGQIVDVIITNPGTNYAPTDTPVFSGAGTSASGTTTLAPANGTYPAGISYFQQRRFFFNSNNDPDTYWASQPGAYTNFDQSIPSEDTDALQGTPWSLKVDGIQWMLTMPLGLLTFCGNGVQQIGAQGSFASSPQSITPTSQFAAPQSSIGCSAVIPPQQINWNVLYFEYNNSAVLDLQYQIFFNIYAGTDISWPSSHLLQNYTVLQWCYCRTPYRVVWMVRNDGVLLSLTYLKEQEVAGWARHDTQGQVRSICSVIEPPVDALYLVVERPVSGGGTAYFIERMDNRLWQTVEDPWCVDAGLSTSLDQPNHTLTASAASGNTVFSTSGAVFVSGDVGKVIRAGGGIATITQYNTAQQVLATWDLPTPLVYPGTTQPIPWAAGNWSYKEPSTTFSGLSHLVGQAVVGLADGIPVGLNPSLQSAFPSLPPQSFGLLIPDSGGDVTLPFAASNVVLGLAFTPQLQSTYLNGGQPTIQGRRKGIYAATARVQNSAICQVGANQTDASTVPPATFVNWTSGMAVPATRYVDPPPPATYTSPGGIPVQPLFTGDMRVNVPTTFRKPGQVAAQQLLPMPLNVLAFIPETQAGDTPEDALPPRQQQQRAG